ncbi:MAG: excalibur calcium-binding domain-containing protein [Actinobacteria bacterium]|nr:excalibur calcium-binding domain-containing protein [Actinomycetota bacterium]
MDCPDFSSQKSAQIYFLKHGGPRYDPDRLDADHDGIACEDNPAPYFYGKRLH